MKAKTPIFETIPTKEEETFLTKKQRKQLISDILNSQQKLSFLIRNREEYPDRKYRNLLMDREEDIISKIKEILINNKY